MPTRILRDWTDSEPVNALSADGERLFTRLIMKADDFGRYTADPALVRASCFPRLIDKIRVADISRWMAECQMAGLIVLYEGELKPLLEIQKFHQRIRRDAKSKYPPRPAASRGDPPEPAATRREFPPDADSKAQAQNPPTPLAKPPRKPRRESAPRQPDLLWDALTAAFGQPGTDAERGKWNRAAKELRDAGVQPAEIKPALAKWRETYRKAEPSPMALAANWSKVRPARSSVDPRRAELERFVESIGFGRRESALSLVVNGHDEWARCQAGHFKAWPVDLLEAVSNVANGKAVTA